MNVEKVAFTKIQNEAIQFIMASHWTQRRKTTVLPYIVHPIEVASFLGRFYPENKPLILGGYLHDTLEDTEATAEAIRDRFGAPVLELVQGVTAKPGATWRETRQGQIDTLKTCSIDVLRLKAADMLSNASAIALDFQYLYGEDCFSKFKGSAEDVRWYYNSAVMAMATRGVHEPIFQALNDTVQKFTNAFWEEINENS